MQIRIDSKFEAVGQLRKSYAEYEVKEEPMLFRADLSFALRNGGPITTDFIEQLPKHFLFDGSLSIDSRVHMLMPGWFPAIPGWHHDDVPRSREDKQPNYVTPEYETDHICCTVGNVCPVEFASGTAYLDEVPLGQKVYEIWDKEVADMVRNEELISERADHGDLVQFNCQTWHQCTKALNRGFRFFIRASIGNPRQQSNELRRNANVYMEAIRGGW